MASRPGHGQLPPRATRWWTAKVDCARNGAACWACLPASAMACWRSAPAARARVMEEGAASLLPGAPTPWRFDPIPLPPQAEFDALEAGLAQRARLLDAVLADLYGPQRLLADGGCRRRWSMPIRPSCGPAATPRHRRARCCNSMPPTSCARRTDAGTCWRIAPRPMASRTRCRTAGAVACVPELFARSSCPSTRSSSSAWTCCRLGAAGGDGRIPGVACSPPGMPARLVRARPAGARTVLRPGRGRRPDGARRRPVPEDAAWPAADRSCCCAGHGRQVDPLELERGTAWPACSPPRATRADRQQPRQRPRRGAGARSLPARPGARLLGEDRSAQRADALAGQCGGTRQSAARSRPLDAAPRAGRHCGRSPPPPWRTRRGPSWPSGCWRRPWRFAVRAHARLRSHRVSAPDGWCRVRCWCACFWCATARLARMPGGLGCVLPDATGTGASAGPVLRKDVWVLAEIRPRSKGRAPPGRRRWRSAAPPATCRAGWATTSSGSGAIWSGWKARRGCCASPSAGSAARRRRRTRWRNWRC